LEEASPALTTDLGIAMCQAGLMERLVASLAALLADCKLEAHPLDKSGTQLNMEHDGEHLHALNFSMIQH
jgi:hypothetical protein